MNWAVVTAKWAGISRNKMYRYVLFRGWDTGRGYVTFVLLNPSTADGKTDDPTIRRCVNFAAMWGYRGCYIVNLYAYRATDPKVMHDAPDPVGPNNEQYLKKYTQLADLVVAAWGAPGEKRGRGAAVIRKYATAKWKCFGVTLKGHPLHPLYLHQMTPLVGLLEVVNGQANVHRSIVGGKQAVLRRSKRSS